MVGCSVDRQSRLRDPQPRAKEATRAPADKDCASCAALLDAAEAQAGFHLKVWCAGHGAARLLVFATDEVQPCHESVEPRHHEPRAAHASSPISNARPGCCCPALKLPVPTAYPSAKVIQRSHRWPDARRTRGALAAARAIDDRQAAVPRTANLERSRCPRRPVPARTGRRFNEMGLAPSRHAGFTRETAPS